MQENQSPPVGMWRGTDEEDPEATPIPPAAMLDKIKAAGFHLESNAAKSVLFGVSTFADADGARWTVSPPVKLEAYAAFTGTRQPGGGRSAETPGKAGASPRGDALAEAYERLFPSRGASVGAAHGASAPALTAVADDSFKPSAVLDFGDRVAIAFEKNFPKMNRGSNP
jgi:hypothetical protein